MMIDKIVVEEKGSVKKIAGLCNGKLAELVVSDKNNAGEGDIFVGKIVKKIKTANNHEGYFVNIGDEKEAFINASERELEDLHANEGQDIIVQVVQEKRAEKGAKLSRFLQLVGQYVVFCPYGCEIQISSKITDEEKREKLFDWASDNLAEGGWIVRTEAADVDFDKILGESKVLESAFADVINKAKSAKAPEKLFCRDNALTEMINRNISFLQTVVVNSHLLEDELKEKVNVEYDAKAFANAGIDEMIGEALAKVVKLKCGGRVIIEETKAFVAIDVDSGDGCLQGNVGLLNKEAAEEIARQIVLRNLSGKIVIDFAGITDFKYLRNIIDTLNNGLADDPMKATVLGLTRAGNVEIIRSRRRPTLADLFTEECASCRGTGRVEK